MKVVHVITPAQFGGLERVVLSLAVGQSRRGHEVGVVAFSEVGARIPPVIAALRSQGVAVTHIELPGRAYRAQCSALRAALLNAKADVVHSHGYVSDVMVALSTMRLGARRVSTAHGFTRGGWRNRTYEFLQRRSYARFDAVVAVSRKLAEDLRHAGVSGRKIHTVPNGCPDLDPPLAGDAARRELSVPLGVFNIGWVGRISREKGLDVLVDALPEIGDAPWRLTVIGDGPERELLQRRLDDLGLSARVQWGGLRADAAVLMRAFDVFVISSRTEGTPMALFEAMHAGVPVVSTSVGGIPDVVSPAEALIVPSEHPGALADAIRTIRDDPDASAQRARAAATRLTSDFSLDSWLDRYDVVYERRDDSRPLKA